MYLVIGPCFSALHEQFASINSWVQGVQMSHRGGSSHHRKEKKKPKPKAKKEEVKEPQEGAIIDGDKIKIPIQQAEPARKRDQKAKEKVGDNNPQDIEGQKAPKKDQPDGTKRMKISEKQELALRIETEKKKDIVAPNSKLEELMRSRIVNKK